MPTPRIFMAVHAVNGVIYAIGGDYLGGTGVTTTTKVEAYNPATNTWTTKVSMPTMRSYFASAEVNGIIYILGGCCETNSGNSLATVEAYDTATNTWTTKASMPAARGMFSAVVVNETIYVIGGQNPWVGNVSYTNKVDAYDPVTNTWSNKGYTTTGFVNVTTVHNGIIYVIDGMWPELHMYDPATGITTKKTSMLHSRIHFSAVTLGGIIYAVSGVQYLHAQNEVYWSGGWGTSLTSVEAYDPVTDAWTDRPDIPTHGFGSSAAILGGAIYVLGGETYPYTGFVSNVDVYRIP